MSICVAIGNKVIDTRLPQPAGCGDKYDVSGWCWRHGFNSFCTFFKYPSPEAYASPSPARGEGSGLLRRCTPRNDAVTNGKGLPRPWCHKILGTRPSMTGARGAGFVRLPRRCTPRNDAVSNNIAFKGLDVVRQYAALLERRVQRGTRARKALAVTRQANPLGRSMIEMLGVLAIIGVLSVGGIAGYSKALSMYKWNKALEQWQYMINTLTTYKSQLRLNDQKVANSETHLVSVLLALDEFPDDMIIPNDTLHVQDALGNILSIYHHGTGYIGILSDNVNNDALRCKLYLNVGKYYHNMVDAVMFYINTNNSSLTKNNLFFGDSNCQTHSQNCLKDLTVSQINEFCKDIPVCKQGIACHALLYWY